MIPQFSNNQEYKGSVGFGGLLSGMYYDIGFLSLLLLTGVENSNSMDSYKNESTCLAGVGVVGGILSEVTIELE